MKRNILLFLFLLFVNLSPIYALTFLKNREDLTLELTYKNDNNILLEIDFNTTADDNIKTVYFWLNDGYKLVQKNYISAECTEKSYNDSKYKFNLTLIDFERIAYYLDYITIERKFNNIHNNIKIVPRKKSWIVRKHFIEKQEIYLRTALLETKLANVQLEYENKKLNDANKKLLIELNETKEKYDKIVNNTTIQQTNHIQQNSINKSNTNKTPSYTYERTTESERVYPPRRKDGKPMYKYKYKYYRNGKWRYRY